MSQPAALTAVSLSGTLRRAFGWQYRQTALAMFIEIKRILFNTWRATVVVPNCNLEYAFVLCHVSILRESNALNLDIDVLGESLDGDAATSGLVTKVLFVLGVHLL